VIFDRIVVVIPARDEAPTLGPVIDDVRSNTAHLSRAVNIVVVADRCTDTTAATAAGRIAMVCSNDEAHLGLGDVYRTGMREALKLKPDIIIQIDADGQYDASVIPALCQRITDGADLAIADRLWRRPACMTRTRYALNVCASRLLGFTLGTRTLDSQSGCRALVPAIARLPTCLSHTYTQEQIARSVRAGFRVDYVKCVFLARKHGTSRAVPNVRTYAVRVLPGLAQIVLGGRRAAPPALQQAGWQRAQPAACTR
jgi:glycosyltransferase involved in cell wall biosynthesis